jgi:signal transduction histidine kinase
VQGAWTTHYGRPARVVAFRDISDYKKALAAQATAREQAEIADRAKSDFLAHMSHELRTPLNSVIGFSDIMRAEILGPLGSKKYVEYANDINTSGSHLLNLINDILDLSRIEAHAMELDEQAVHLPVLISDSLRIVVIRAKERRQAVTVDAPDDLAMLWADERRIKQVILNLLSNAIKFTPEEGKIDIRAFLSDTSELVLSVSDTGIGIAEKDLLKILEPFGQVGNVMNREVQGSGLGLPLSKRLVEGHGGTLSIHSVQGSGTTIEVRFPAARTRKNDPITDGLDTA